VDVALHKEFARRTTILRSSRSEDPAARYPTLDALLEALERGASHRGLFSALAAALALSAALGGWVLWKARPVEMPAPASLPAPVVMVVDEPVLQVERGDVKLYELTALSTAAAGDGSIAGVEVPHPGELLLRGVGVGETTLRVTLDDGRSVEWRVQVTRPEP
jgi:hypothetical protein